MEIGSESIRIRLCYTLITAAPAGGGGWGCRPGAVGCCQQTGAPGQRARAHPSGAHAFRPHAPGSGLAVRARGREAARHGRDGIVPADCSLQQDDYCLEGPSQPTTGGAASDVAVEAGQQQRRRRHDYCTRRDADQVKLSTLHGRIGWR
jgi:hypothetical protein